MGRIEERLIKVPYANHERKLRIYLPDNYDKNPTMKFPVLYAHDGQNMYYDQDATYGCAWRAHEAAERLEEEGLTDGIIIVAVDNWDAKRRDEYSPWVNTIKLYYMEEDTFGGDGDKYCEFMVKELKPFIDQEYRTLSDRENTGIIGSSMGGYISVYIAAKYPEVFSKIGSFSTASWFNEKDFLQFLDNAQALTNQRYFIQVGTQEGYNDGTKINKVDDSQLYIDCTLRLHNKLLEKGVSYNNLRLVIGADEYHNELFWRKHLPSFLECMFCS